MINLRDLDDSSSSSDVPSDDSSNNGTTRSNLDIAVLMLESKLDLALSVRAACLPLDGFQLQGVAKCTGYDGIVTLGRTANEYEMDVQTMANIEDGAGIFCFIDQRMTLTAIRNGNDYISIGAYVSWIEEQQMNGVGLNRAGCGTRDFTDSGHRIIRGKDAAAG